MVEEGGTYIQFSNLIYLLSYLLRSSMQNLVLKKLHHKTRPGGKYVLNAVKILLPMFICFYLHNSIGVEWKVQIWKCCAFFTYDFWTLSRTTIIVVYIKIGILKNVRLSKTSIPKLLPRWGNLKVATWYVTSSVSLMSR